jgi:long-chain acyl-CoA synthetase
MDGHPQPNLPNHSQSTNTAAIDAPARPWLAHYSPGVPATIEIPDRPLTSVLDDAVAHYGANVAIEYYGTRIRYVQLASLVNRFARALRELGVEPGERVSLCLPNVPQFVIAFYAVLKVGAVVVPTNPLYTQPELEHQLNDSGATVIVMLDQFYPNLAAIRERTPVRHVVLASAADYLPPALALGYHLKEARERRGQPHFSARALRADPSIHWFKSLIGSAHDREGYEVFEAPQLANPDELAVLQYTGGTTGVAKGAMLTHRNLLANAHQCWAWNELSPGSEHSSLCIAPFFHVYGLTVGMNLTILNGSTLVLLPRFTVGEALSAIAKYKPDLFPGVPTLYLALAREVEKGHQDLSSIKICISGSAPLPLEVQQRFERLSGARVVEGYGLTEASPVTHCNPVFGERRIGTIGVPMPSTDAAIINPETWEFLPPGEVGEIVVHGPQVMRGYWQRPDETEKVLRDGWLKTGDIGSMSEDGYFTISDRAKDIIIASGYKVFPREVEEVLYQHPKVLEAAVVGVPDPYRGETVRAYIVAKPGEKPTAEELEAYSKEHLAIYKVPKQIVFRDALPKSMIGKVVRRTLREEAIATMNAAGTPSQPS